MNHPTEEVPDEFTSHSARAMTKLVLSQLLGYIPYDAIVTRVKGRKLEINVGTRGGASKGASVTIFEITRFEPVDESSKTGQCFFLTA